MYYLKGQHTAIRWLKDQIICFYLNEFMSTILYFGHWRIQNAEKDTHTKGRLLDQAVVLFNCTPLQNVNFS